MYKYNLGVSQIESVKELPQEVLNYLGGEAGQHDRKEPFLAKYGLNPISKVIQNYDDYYYLEHKGLVHYSDWKKVVSSDFLEFKITITQWCYENNLSRRFDSWLKSRSESFREHVSNPKYRALLGKLTRGAKVQYGKLTSRKIDVTLGAEMSETQSVNNFIRKSDVLRLGKWPSWFIKDMISPIPDIRISSHVKLQWLCSEHGPYTQEIANHLKGSGCPKCAVTRREVNKKKKTILPEWLWKEVEGTKAEEILKSGQFNLNTELEFICPKHGPYKQKLQSHLRGHRCFYCGMESTLSQTRLKERKNNPFSLEFLKALETSPDKDRILKGELGTHDIAVFYCEKHGYYRQQISYKLNGSKCPKCYTGQYRSNYELKLQEFIQENGIKVLVNQKMFSFPNMKSRFEIDLYLPDYNLAIECNGLYWHSSDRAESIRVPIEQYHKLKTDICKKNGIQLLHFFEDDLRDRWDICCNMILSKCGLLSRKKVYARKCDIININGPQVKEFYNKWHIQGYGQGIAKALIYKGRIVSMMSVRRGPSNTSSDGAWELNRYASVSDIFVAGGFEKLFEAFTKEFHIHKWISYADKLISNGSLYFHQGWTLDSESEPDYKYVYKGERRHKFNFRIKRFKEDPELKYEEGMTERQLAELNKIPRIYDCGKMKFIKYV